MCQVTVPSVSANNLQILLPVHSLAYTSVHVYYSVEATDQVILCKARSWFISQKKEVGFEQISKHLMNLDFPNGKHLLMGGWAFIFTLLQNDQNASFLCTCSILEAHSHPSNIQNLPLVIASKNTTKNVSLNVFYGPPNT